MRAYSVVLVAASLAGCIDYELVRRKCEERGDVVIESHGSGGHNITCVPRDYHGPLPQGGDTTVVLPPPVIHTH